MYPIIDQASYADGTCFSGVAAKKKPLTLSQKDRFGLVARATCPGFNASAAGKDCKDLSPPKHRAETLEDCAAACCKDPGCTVYQFCPAGKACGGLPVGKTGPACFVGEWAGCGTDSREGWVGMGAGTSRPPPPPAPPTQTTVSGVRIEHNYFSKAGTGKASKATLSLTQANATQWVFDFCDVLVFKQVAVTKVHVTAASGFPTAVARPATGCTVLVETSVAVTGTVTVEADSSVPTVNFL